MMRTYNGLVHLNGNLMAALDFETTGTKAGYHEIIQIAVVPLNADFRPLQDVRPFYHNIAPEHPERADNEAKAIHRLNLEDLMLNAPSSQKVADMLVEWWEKLDLPFNRSLVPLAHNWAFESGFGKAWLGDDLMNHLFFGHARDGMLYALAQNDQAAFAGRPIPFATVGLKSLCSKFKVVNENPHDALCDCLAEAEVYRALLQYDRL